MRTFDFVIFQVLYNDQLLANMSFDQKSDTSELAGQTHSKADTLLLRLLMLRGHSSRWFEMKRHALLPYDVQL